MIPYNTKQRLARKARIRKKVKGTSDRPRLTVYKSMKHIYTQVVDDSAGETLASTSTVSKEFKDRMKSAKNLEAAKLVGEIVADKLIQRGIKKLVFDRNGYIYHGKIAAIVEKVREKGIIV
ncbi:MAG: 50S ribosomal protein L18 [Nitrospinota bacterium]|jgi:large subunit ribosomal protein L18|nr:MAG: 50S ribosomal protein L18 [Nitrospinae bacterium RIFCSPHIGHO2_02_39_11]OGV99934.1 MAG: 50S ribosomal protein L18 [Nitrospinae bacterium RIFCSPHIGHO2_12_FULL_39_42]OGW02128.1 MAG: 50S ribosomal protein L18 [Nitrospinae bacterium RIFCSPHIGHO2_02_FULL_39_82]OGW02317.1 MAG: 50S ribosomal protein L18 [Nitrospinae bacterium RIFCSPLOWO2_02_39_17]OGW04675.1 MAG: 50S ribosomal protein L18 [Nitrospinae bacterium RIFCSPLOWO2_02_FULL_39_110]OGW09908.1 MAG: 50S ribosomal protein L18 [Nitrospinae ba